RVCLCLGWRRELIELVRIKNAGLHAYLIASGFHRALGKFNSPFEFFKLGDLVAMLCLQCPINEQLAVGLGNSRETWWGHHKSLSRNRVERIWIARQCVSLLLRHCCEVINRPEH